MKNLLLVLPMFIMAASFTFSQGDSIVQATILTEAEIQADVKYNEGVALLHSNVIHGSEKNISDRFRKAFLTGYIKEGAKFAAGAQMNRKPIDVGSAKL